MNANFTELTSNEMEIYNGGGVCIMLLCAGGALVVGTGIGWAIGYFLG